MQPPRRPPDRSQADLTTALAGLLGQVGCLSGIVILAALGAGPAPGTPTALHAGSGPGKHPAVDLPDGSSVAERDDPHAAAGPAERSGGRHSHEHLGGASEATGA